MFDSARKEVALRIVEGRIFLSRAAKVPRGERVAAATCRGFLFVQLYGIYEYAVTRAVQAALDTVKRDFLGHSEIRRSLLALVLDAEFDSAAKAGRERLWERRIALMVAADDDTPALGFRDNVFPGDGSHYRARQLTTVWKILGMGAPILPSVRFVTRIDELVENRNAIAHGRHTPREVGGRYTNGDMKKWIDDTDAIAHYVIDTVKAHCLAGGLNRPF